MKVTAEICVIPLGVGLSVSRYIAACQPILEAWHLKPQLHAYGTNVEGEWDDVFAAFKECHQTIHDLGAPRVHTTIKVGSRTDRPQTNDDKIAAVHGSST